MGQFIASVNGGDIGGGAIVAPLGSDAWGEYAYGDPAGSLAVVPAGARGGEGISPEDVMLLTGGSEESGGEITYSVESSGALVPVDSWIPSTNWNPSDPYEDDYYWTSNSPYEDDYFWTTNDPYEANWYWTSDNPEDIGVLVPNIEVVMDRIGMEELPEDAEMVEEGDTVEAENISLASLGDVGLNPPFTDTDEPISLDEPLFPDDPLAPELFDAGAQAPIGGAGFGMGVLSTPSATVAGQDANPIIQVSSEDLLTRDETADLLSNAGISDADSIEWEAGPESVSAESDYETPELMGEEAELELFTGVVSGGEAPWGVTLGIARGTPDDHVITIGLNRRPVGTAEGGLEAVQADQHVVDNMAEMLAETVPELQSG